MIFWDIRTPHCFWFHSSHSIHQNTSKQNMQGVKVIACLLVLSGASNAVLLPNSTLDALRSGGADTITTAYEEDNTRLTEAYTAFQPVNTSCNTQLNQTTEACGNCVADKCRKR